MLTISESVKGHVGLNRLRLRAKLLQAFFSPMRPPQITEAAVHVTDIVPAAAGSTAVFRVSVLGALQCSATLRTLPPQWGQAWSLRPR